MLRVRQVDEEAEDEQHVRPNRDALEHADPIAVESAGDEIGDRRPLARIVVQAQRDLARVPEQQRYDDAADPRENQVGLAEMAAGESLGPLHQSNRVGGDHAGQHAHREDVDQQRVRPLGSEPRQGRVRVGRADHRDDDGREQDDEAPEDHRVHQSRAEALQQLALADHHDRLGARSRGQLVEPRSGLALAHDAVEAASSEAVTGACGSPPRLPAPPLSNLRRLSSPPAT